MSEWRAIFDSSNSWKDIIDTYNDRLNLLRDVMPETSNAFDATRDIPMYGTDGDSDRSRLVSSIYIYACAQFNVSRQAVNAIITMWKDGLFILLPLNTRYVLEVWSAMHYAHKLFMKTTNGYNLDELRINIQKLTLGARSNTWEYWGTSDAKSHNIMKFIQHLDKDENGVEDQYNFLSEASHPNLVQSGYLQLMGPPISKWNEAAFKENAIPLLDRTLCCLESSDKGIQRIFQELAPAALAFILKERGISNVP